MGWCKVEAPFAVTLWIPLISTSTIGSIPPILNLQALLGASFPEPELANPIYFLAWAHPGHPKIPGAGNPTEFAPPL